jgi:uncharacterized protein (DUF608 family)
MSPDRKFLDSVWPSVKKATDWLITKFDSDEDGVTSGDQWNTYDSAVSGANTFIGSLYLSALAASSKMAVVEGDAGAAKRYDKIRVAGQKNQDTMLWNGEYYIQIPGQKPASDYNTGCHSDQLLGQWWAHILNDGLLYPQDRILSACDSIMKYNYKENFNDIQQSPRRYVLNNEGGLLTCSWPKGGRPKSFINHYRHQQAAEQGCGLP